MFSFYSTILQVLKDFSWNSFLWLSILITSLKLPNARWFSVRRPSTLQTEFHPTAFWNRFRFSRWKPWIAGTCFWTLPAGWRLSGEAGKWLQRTVGGSVWEQDGRSRKPSCSCTPRPGPQAMLESATIICLLHKYILGRVCFLKLYGYIFIASMEQWASLRLAWQLLALYCQGNYLAAHGVSCEQVSTWPQSFSSLSQCRRAVLIQQNNPWSLAKSPPLFPRHTPRLNNKT